MLYVVSILLWLFVVLSSLAIFGLCWASCIGRCLASKQRLHIYIYIYTYIHTHTHSFPTFKIYSQLAFWDDLMRDTFLGILETLVM